MLIKSLLLDLKIKLWFDNINLYRWISCCPFLHGFFLKFLLLCISLSFILFPWFLEQLHENDQNLRHCNHNPLRITNWWEHVQYLITINLERKDLFYWGCNTQAIKQTDIICSLPFSCFNSLLFFIRWTRKHSIDERFVAGNWIFFFGWSRLLHWLKPSVHQPGPNLGSVGRPNLTTHETTKDGNLSSPKEFNLRPQYN